MKKRKGDEGSILIAAVIFTVVLSMMLGTYLLLSANEYRWTQNAFHSTVAVNLAEAGVEDAIWELNYASFPFSSTRGWTQDDGSGEERKSVSAFQDGGGNAMGDIEVRVDQNASPMWIEATGYTPSQSDPGRVKRTVKVELTRSTQSPFSEVFFGDDKVKLTGTSETDSYDSREGAYGGDNVGSEGGIATNGTDNRVIELLGSVEIDGNVATGPGGTLRTTGQSTYTGDITHEMDRDMPAVEVPADLAAADYSGEEGLLTLTGSESATLPPGDYKMKRIKLTGSSQLTIEGPATIYLTGQSGKSVHQTSGDIVVAGNGSVVLYADDKVHLTGNGITNASGLPENFLVYGTPGCDDVHITGSHDGYLAVYAPNAEIHLSGSTDQYGSFVGKDIDATGSGDYHYDVALGSLGSDGGLASIVSWIQK